MNKISELSTKRNKLIADAQVLVNEGKAASEEYRTLIAEIDLIQGDIDTLQKIERMLPSAITTSNAPALVATPAPAVIQSESKEKRKVKLNSAFRSLLLHGYNGTRAEQRDLDTLTDVNGTALVLQEFTSDYVMALKWAAPLVTLVRDITQNPPRPTKIPVVDDTAAVGTFLPDAGQAFNNTVSTPAVSSLIPATDTITTSLRYSVEFESDTFDMSKFLQDVAAPRIGRILELALLKGVDGHGTALPNSPTGGLLASVQTGIVTASLAAGVSYQNLVDLMGSLDRAYRELPTSAFLVSQNTWTSLARQVTTTGKPLFHFDDDGYLVVAGKRVYVAANMPNSTSASVPAVLFGSFQHAYAALHSDVRIQVLHERFIDQFEKAAVVNVRYGAATLLPNSLKALVTASS